MTHKLKRIGSKEKTQKLYGHKTMVGGSTQFFDLLPFVKGSDLNVTNISLVNFVIKTIWLCLRSIPNNTSHLSKAGYYTEITNYYTEITKFLIKIVEKIIPYIKKKTNNAQTLKDTPIKSAEKTSDQKIAELEAIIEELNKSQSEKDADVLKISEEIKQKDVDLQTSYNEIIANNIAKSKEIETILIEIYNYLKPFELKELILFQEKPIVDLTSFVDYIIEKITDVVSGESDTAIKNELSKLTNLVMILTFNLESLDNSVWGDYIDDANCYKLSKDYINQIEIINNKCNKNKNDLTIKQKVDIARLTGNKKKYDIELSDLIKTPSVETPVKPNPLPVSHSTPPPPPPSVTHINVREYRGNVEIPSIRIKLLESLIQKEIEKIEKTKISLDAQIDVVNQPYLLKKSKIITDLVELKTKYNTHIKLTIEQNKKYFIKNIIDTLHGTEDKTKIQTIKYGFLIKLCDEYFNNKVIQKLIIESELWETQQIEDTNYNFFNYNKYIDDTLKQHRLIKISWPIQISNPIDNFKKFYGLENLNMDSTHLYDIGIYENSPYVVMSESNQPNNVDSGFKVSYNDINYIKIDDKQIKSNISVKFKQKKINPSDYLYNYCSLRKIQRPLKNVYYTEGNYSYIYNCNSATNIKYEDTKKINIIFYQKDIYNLITSPDQDTNQKFSDENLKTLLNEHNFSMVDILLYIMYLITESYHVKFHDPYTNYAFHKQLLVRLQQLISLHVSTHIYTPPYDNININSTSLSINELNLMKNNNRMHIVPRMGNTQMYEIIKINDRDITNLSYKEMSDLIEEEARAATAAATAAAAAAEAALAVAGASGASPPRVPVAAAAPITIPVNYILYEGTDNTPMERAIFTLINEIGD